MSNCICTNPQQYVFGQRDDPSLQTLCSLQTLFHALERACAMHENKKDDSDNNWQDSVFALIMKQY